MIAFKSEKQKKFYFSNLSIRLLRKILGEENVDETLTNIFVFDEILILDNKTLIPFNESTIKIKRNDKQNYNYIDFFSEKNQYNFILDTFGKYNPSCKIISSNNFIKLQDDNRVIILTENDDYITKGKYWYNMKENILVLICKYYDLLGGN
jgi:hypothetical protein